MQDVHEGRLDKDEAALQRVNATTVEAARLAGQDAREDKLLAGNQSGIQSNVSALQSRQDVHEGWLASDHEALQRVNGTAIEADRLAERDVLQGKSIASRAFAIEANVSALQSRQDMHEGWLASDHE